MHEYVKTGVFVNMYACIHGSMFTRLHDYTYFSFCASVIIEEILVKKLRYYAVLI